MSQPSAIDYLAAAIALAVFRKNSTRVTHVLTPTDLDVIFYKEFEIALAPSHRNYAVQRLELLGIANLIQDPYAETIIEMSDQDIYDKSTGSGLHAFEQTFKNFDWIRSALKNDKLWQDINSGLETVEGVATIPSSDGFVTADHNSLSFVETETAVAEADNAIRGDNEFDGDERGWIRVHIDLGVQLLKRGGPILKNALVSLIVEPLKAALKATANENVKRLISLALTAILKWLGL